MIKRAFHFKDVDVRVIDQRIGVGIGGLNTVIRVYHPATGILIEVPNSVARHQYKAREIAFDMLDAALTHPDFDSIGKT